MKQMRKISVMLILVLLIGMLSGCTSAESVLTKMAENMAGKTLTKASFDMPLSMGIDVMGDRVDCELELSGTMYLSEDPYTFYGEIKYEGEVAGEWLSDKMEIYYTNEDGQYVMYFYSNTADSWIRTDTGLTEADLTGEPVDLFSLDGIDFDSEQLVLAEETEIIDGSETYVVSYTFPGQLMQDEYDELGGFSGMLEEAFADTSDTALPDDMDLSALAALDDLDFTALSMPVTLYIDKETYELKQVDMEYVGFQSMMDQIVEVILQVAADMAGEDLSALGLDGKISFAIPDIAIQLTDLSYDPVEVKSVPEEGVIRGKQASFVPAQEDGSYVIQEYGDAVRVVPLSGQNVTAVDYNMLQLSSADGYAATAYTMLGSEIVEEDFFDYIATEMDSFVQQGFHVTTADSALDDYTVRTLNIEGSVIFYAWKHIGDGWLLVEALNVFDPAMATVLQPALDAVSAYTLP